MLKLDCIEFEIEEVMDTSKEQKKPSLEKVVTEDTSFKLNAKGIALHKCPKCGKQSLKIENGCQACMNEDCGYGKCE